MPKTYCHWPRKSSPRAQVPLDLVIITPRKRLEMKCDEFCREHGTTFAELRSHQRVGRAVLGPENESSLLEVFRGLIQFLRDTKKWSYPEIGQFLGRDHATIQYHHNPKRRARQDAIYARIRDERIARRAEQRAAAE